MFGGEDRMGSGVRLGEERVLLVTAMLVVVAG